MKLFCLLKYWTYRWIPLGRTPRNFLDVDLDFLEDQVNRLNHIRDLIWKSDLGK